jgi:outer membrane receptor for ferrienterochelin and colicin
MIFFHFSKNKKGKEKINPRLTQTLSHCLNAGIHWNPQEDLTLIISPYTSKENKRNKGTTRVLYKLQDKLGL